MPAPKKRAKVSRSPAERPARSRHELLIEHNLPRERNDCYMVEPMGDVFEEQLPTQMPRARKPVKVCIKNSLYVSCLGILFFCSDLLYEFVS